MSSYSHKTPRLSLLPLPPYSIYNKAFGRQQHDIQKYSRQWVLNVAKTTEQFKYAKKKETQKKNKADTQKSFFWLVCAVTPRLYVSKTVAPSLRFPGEKETQKHSFECLRLPRETRTFGEQLCRVADLLLSRLGSYTTWIVVARQA